MPNCETKTVILYVTLKEKDKQLRNGSELVVLKQLNNKLIRKYRFPSFCSLETSV